MSLRFLFDTDALSEPAKSRPNPGFIRRVTECAGRIAISSVTWHEALTGLHAMPTGRRRNAVERYLLRSVVSSVPILSYDRAAAEWHARERHRLERKGTPVPLLDGQIAAVAVANGLTLVTFNVRHFRRFSDLEIEDWRE